MSCLLQESNDFDMSFVTVDELSSFFQDSAGIHSGEQGSSMGPDIREGVQRGLCSAELGRPMALTSTPV